MSVLRLSGLPLSPGLAPLLEVTLELTTHQLVDNEDRAAEGQQGAGDVDEGKHVAEPAVQQVDLFCLDLGLRHTSVMIQPPLAWWRWTMLTASCLKRPRSSCARQSPC